MSMQKRKEVKSSEEGKSQLWKCRGMQIYGSKTTMVVEEYSVSGYVKMER